jgi:hypothetical protein
MYGSLLILLSIGSHSIFSPSTDAPSISPPPPTLGRTDNQVLDYNAMDGGISDERGDGDGVDAKTSLSLAFFFS